MNEELCSTVYTRYDAASSGAMQRFYYARGAADKSSFAPFYVFSQVLPLRTQVASMRTITILTIQRATYLC